MLVDASAETDRPSEPAWARSIGVVRVARTTGLDTLGVEVVSAVRADPIGESVSVATGRGWDLETAFRGAVFEAYERWAAEPRGRVRIRSATPDDLGHRAVPLASLELDPALLPDASTRLGWVRAVVIGSGDPRLVPVDLVLFPLTADMPGARIATPETTGLSVGRTTAAAVGRGLLECIERDALSWLVHRLERGDRVAAVGARLQGRVARAAERARTHGVDTVHAVWATDVGVPVASVTLVERDGPSTLGLACRPDAADAIEAAWLEAAQARATLFQGAREDLPDHVPVPHPFFLETPPAGPVPPPGPAHAGDLAARVEAVTGHPPLWVDLSHRSVPAAAGRVVCPGLSAAAIDPSRRGRRWNRWNAGS